MTELEQRLLSELDSLEKALVEEREVFESYLKLFYEELKAITTLLKTPPKGEDTVQKLKPILSEFFSTLETNLTASNKELVTQIETLIKE